MSDIGLKGVAGFIVIGATALLAALVTLIGAAAALVISYRRKVQVGPTLARYTAGPFSATAIAMAGLAWSWDGASESVDQLAPLIALASVLVGVAAAVLVRRSLRVTKHRLPPS
jgi:hypothetical protein